MRYFHVVFTLPHELHTLVLQNQAELYNLLFRTVAETLREVARNPEHLGAEIGFFGVLHTWGQNLLFHPHIHCVIPGGGISPDGKRWIHPRYPFFLPVRALSKVFRGKFVAGLRQALRKNRLTCAGTIQHLAEPKHFAAFLRTLFRQDWVVYAKPAFGGPEQVIRYLGRYTHRVAISNHRLIAFDGDHVTFRWRDYAGGNKTRTMMVTADEFIRRFLLHVLPKGFVRIRHFGVMANYRRSESIDLCRKLLGMTPVRAFNRQRSDNAIRVVPHLSKPSDRHPEADGRSTVLEDLIERVSPIPRSEYCNPDPSTCLGTPAPNVCLPARATVFPIVATRISPDNLSTDNLGIAFRGTRCNTRRASSRDNFNPHSRTFSID